MDALRQALQTFPAGSWTLEVVVEPPRWIVYLGKYPTVEILNRKKAELRRLGISFENPSNQVLEGGLSLGGFSSQAAANEQLDRLTDRGLRSARVVQERLEMRGQVLKLPAVDETVRPRLDELRPALNGKPLRPCR